VWALRGSGAQSVRLTHFSSWSDDEQVPHSHYGHGDNHALQQLHPINIEHWNVQGACDAGVSNNRRSSHPAQTNRPNRATIFVFFVAK
jgi:hypothetical protein